MTFFLNRNSFFDDSDPTIKFDWEKLGSSIHKEILKQGPLIAGSLNCSVANALNNSPTHCLLFPKCIVQFKNADAKQPDGVLDISNAKVQKISNGFSLTKNGKIFEFTSKNEAEIKNWFNLLKGICVLVTFHDDYKALKMIGKGSFAKVYLVESNTTGKQFAAKAFTKETLVASNKNNAKISIINEIDIMRCISHENIIQLYEVYESERSIYLVLELIQGKSLQETLQKATFKETYSEIKIINMIRSILDALAYIASKGIMHRDLKPDNILLDKSDKIKVVDFGLATYIKVDNYIFKKCGTPGYIAPEVFKYDEKNSLTNYDDRCDVFSAGCILFYLLFGYPFFDGGDGSEILQLNRKFNSEFDAIATVKKELKSPISKISKDGLLLLLELLEFDKRRRKRAADCLEHPFFTPLPSDTKKAVGTIDSISKKIPDSPRADNTKGTLHINLMNQNPIKYQKEKYEQKDSLYIDVGQSLLNGKTDTLTGSGVSNNNSLLIAQSPRNSGSNSLSKFAKGGKAGGNDLRKLVIMKNTMQGADSDSESPRLPSFKERSNSIGPGQTNFSRKDSGKESSKEDSKEDCEDDSGDSSEENTPSEDPQIQNNIQRFSQAYPDKHPSKLITSGKRYSLIENRSAGNSPKTAGRKDKGGQYSKFGEEAKSPTKK